MSADRRHVALVGLSGAGKSTVAPLLASRLVGFIAIDLDRVVAERFGKSIDEIFAESGEGMFRDAESEALSEAMDGPPAVIATGGGVVLDPANRQTLGGARVVWLDAHPDHLVQRLAESTESRPLLDGDPGFALSRLHEERSALYAQVADLTIDVEGAAPIDVADEIARALG